MRSSKVLALLLLWVSFAHAGIVFDGTDDYAITDASGTFDFSNTTVTVSLRFRATTTGGTVYIFAKRTTASDGGYFARIATTGEITARIISTDAQAVAERTTTSNTALDGNWHSLAVVLTTDTSVQANNSISLYYDGALNQGSLTSSTSNAYTPSVLDFTFGAPSNLSSSLNGEVAAVRIFQGAVTAAQAETLHKAKLAGPYVGPGIASFPLAQCGDGASGNGVAFFDTSGNGHTFTPNDGANNTGVTCTGSILAWPVGAN